MKLYKAIGTNVTHTKKEWVKIGLELVETRKESIDMFNADVECGNLVEVAE